MDNEKQATRRRFLTLAGLGAAGALAGCINNDQGTPPEEQSDLLTATAKDYLSNANQYDGTVTDRRQKDTVTVDVGAGNNGLAFAPPVIRVSQGTTVRWEWTGEGGKHNVVARDGTFDSGEPVADGSTTYEYTFENEGEFLYFCEPHESFGKKGAVVVGDGASSSSGDGNSTAQTSDGGTY